MKTIETDTQAITELHQACQTNTVRFASICMLYCLRRERGVPLMEAFSGVVDMLNEVYEAERQVLINKPVGFTGMVVPNTLRTQCSGGESGV